MATGLMVHGFYITAYNWDTREMTNHPVVNLRHHWHPTEVMVSLLAGVTAESSWDRIGLQAEFGSAVS